MEFNYQYNKVWDNTKLTVKITEMIHSIYYSLATDIHHEHIMGAGVLGQRTLGIKILNNYYKIFNQLYKKM